MRRAFVLAALIVLGAVFPSLVAATTYWVSPTGSVGASGADSSANAKTLAWFNANAVQGDICRFKHGTYTDAIWPGNGTSGSARQNQLRYYGFPNSPNAVVVASIRLAGISTSTSNPKAGDSCTVRWIKATGRIEGSPSYPGAGAVTTVAVYDSIVKCSGTGNFEWGSQNSVYDSLTIALDGTGQELIDAYDAGVAGTGLRPQNNAIKNSTFTATINRVGQQHVLAAAYGGFNTIFGNTFNLTMNSCTDYWFPVEFYHQSNNLLQNNTWNITMNATPAGTHAIWAYRDTATFGGTTSGHRFFNNVVNVNGSGSIDLGLSQSGSQSASTGGNYIGYNTISIQTPANGAFYWQNGARGDTVEFNVVKTGTGGIHNVAMYNSSTAFQNTIVRHNTFYSSTATVVDIGPSTPVTGSRFCSNIYYGTAANGAGSENTIMPSGMALDSAGVVFNPGGSAAFGFKVGGVTGIPGSGGGYGTAGKALWGSPRFTDSTFASLNTVLLGGSYATGGSLQDGFAGALGVTVISGHSEVVSAATQVWANRTSIGVRVFITGDDDSTAVCRLFYRRFGTTAAYDSGMVMTRRVGTTTHAGKLMFLREGCTYQLYVEITDGGVKTLTPVQQSTTRTKPVRGAGPLVWVNPNGNDSHTGADSTAAHALLTVQGGVDKLIGMGVSGAGGTVMLAPGTYYGKVLMQYQGQAAPDLPYSIESATTGNPGIITGSGITGGIPQPSFSRVGATTVYAATWTHSDSIAGAFNGTNRYHRVTTYTELNQRAGTTVGGSWSAIPVYMLTAAKDTLYVNDGTVAVPAAFDFGYLPNLVWLQVPYWRLYGVTFTKAGGSFASNQGYCVRVGAGGVRTAGAYQNGNATTIDKCLFQYPSRDCIVGTPGSDSVIVDVSSFAAGTKALGYAATKGTDEETSCITIGGALWDVNNNTITNATNAINGAASQADSSCNSECDIRSNTITQCTDDAVELELAHCINTAVTYNVITRCNNGVSMAPIWSGPEYVFYNRIRNSEEGAFKLGEGGGVRGSTGYALIANNSAYSNARFLAVNSPGGSWQNKHFRNNILVSGATDAVINGVNPATVTTGFPDSTGAFTNDFNYDLIDTTATARVAIWTKTDFSATQPSSFPDIQNRYGWEKNGVRAHASFADSTAATISAGSAAGRAGVRIAGVNSDTAGVLTYHTAPDIGAVPFSPDNIRPAKTLDLTATLVGGKVFIQWTSPGNDSLTGNCPQSALFIADSLGQKSAQTNCAGITLNASVGNFYLVPSLNTPPGVVQATSVNVTGIGYTFPNTLFLSMRGYDGTNFAGPGNCVTVRVASITIVKRHSWLWRTIHPFVRR